MLEIFSTAVAIAFDTTYDIVKKRLLKMLEKCLRTACKMLEK
jgi:hypothetical protein